MSAIMISPFMGEAPKINPKMLASLQAQVAKNCLLYHKDLRPLNAPSLTYTPTKAGTQNSAYLFGGQYWFTWSEYVDAVRSAIAGDTTERTYFTGVGNPQMTDNTIALQGGTLYPMKSYDLGVPAPTNAPTVNAGGVNADAALNETRSYVYTYVSAVGEEGPPSPASAAQDFDVAMFDAAAWAANKAYSIGNYANPTVATGFYYVATTTGTSDPNNEPVWPAVNGGTVVDGGVTWKAIQYVADITAMDGVPAGNYNIATKRIYRTNTSAYATEFQFVAEVAVATATYGDNIASDALAEVLATANYDMPPSTLEGLIVLPNGGLAGFTGNELCQCEPYQFHAWPLEYRLSTNWPIVGLAAYGNTILVTTTGRPYLVYGATPGTRTMQELDVPLSCVSKRSVVKMGYNVAYASPDGLVVAGNAGLPSLVTSGLFAPEDWAKLNPSSIAGYYWRGMYVGFYDATTLGGGKGCFMLDPLDPAGSLSFSDIYATGAFLDETDDKLYIIEATSNTVMEFDAGAAKSYTWRSKVFNSIREVNFGAMRLRADAYPVTVNIYGDGVLRHTVAVADNKAATMPGGYTATDWEVELVGNQNVTEFAMAESMRELARL